MKTELLKIPVESPSAARPLSPNRFDKHYHPSNPLQSRLISHLTFRNRSRSKMTHLNDSRSRDSGYSNVRAPTRNSGTVFDQYNGRDANHELGVFKPVTAYVGTGKSDHQSEIGVHLTYDMQQESHHSSDGLHFGAALYTNPVGILNHHTWKFVASSPCNKSGEINNAQGLKSKASV